MAPEKQNALRALAKAADALEAARAVQDPGQRARDMDAAYQAAAEAFASLVGEVALQRAAAACAGYEPTDPKGLDPETLEHLRQGMDRTALAHPLAPTGCRAMLARLVLDHAGLLPPGLALEVATGLYRLDLGEAPPMFKPNRRQGWSSFEAARRYFARLGLYARIYYRMGYYQQDLDDAIASEEADAPEVEAGKVTAGAMHKFAQRERVRHLFDRSRAQGEQDGADGRPFSPPIASQYSFNQLRKLEQYGHG